MHLEFPAMSLIGQFFRQITKPISKRIVGYASRRPIFRRYFLLVPGRLYYQLEKSLYLLKRAESQTAIKKAMVIDDEKAIEVGSHLMIEVVIFALLTLVMMLEWQRSQWKSADKEEIYKTGIDTLQENLDNLLKKVEAVQKMREETENRYAEVKSLLFDDTPRFPPTEI